MIERLVVAGGRVLTLGGWDERDVVVERGRIVSASGRARPSEANRLDASGLLVVPGFVDVQINGAFGNDFTADPGSIWRVGARLPASGVTAFLPTLVSPRAGEVEAAIDVLAAGPPSGYAGAAPLGLHCEGPMLSPRRRGVHRASRLRAPSAAVIRGWSRDRGIALVTLAPELRGASAVTRTLLRRGVIVAAGHSDATYEQATRAFARGIGAGTHLFNAMSGLHHRSPGLAGALLAAGDVPAGLIADGIHVHAAAVELA
ncbi:MAG: amidohydrolase family protein [Candidatus Rokuibacteriota bacterium]